MFSGPIIEAVPNFSEGRRQEVIDAIADSIQTPGVFLLHRTSDADHNRSVFTVVGAPDAVVEGLFQAVKTAAQLINLYEHRGVHPRTGAADVVPLVPIRSTTLADCVLWARQLGARIGDGLDLPVYLYAAAAARAERRDLAAVRRGEFEGLVAEINLPHRRPDYGPARMGPAGAVVVGARPFLIAFNVFLKSNDVAIAKAIARVIRESSGGLPAVKALGLLVDGQAQVSMNLVDFQRTPPHVVVERIGAEAARLGVEIERSELIGLIPQDALIAAAAKALHLPDLTNDRVLEWAIQHAEEDKDAEA